MSSLVDRARRLTPGGVGRQGAGQTQQGRRAVRRADRPNRARRPLFKTTNDHQVMDLDREAFQSLGARLWATIGAGAADGARPSWRTQGEQEVSAG